MKIVVNRIQNNRNVAIFVQKKEKSLKYLHISEKKCTFATEFGSILSNLIVKFKKVMGNLLNLFMDYFNTLTPEQVQADWDTLKEFNTFGPLALSTIENSQYCFNSSEQMLVCPNLEITENEKNFSLAA